MKSIARLWLQAFTEAAKCLTLGTRDALSLGLLIRSAAISILAFVAWTWIYYYYSSEITAFLEVLSYFSAYGLVLSGFQGLTPLPAQGGSVASMGNIAFGALQYGQALIVVSVILFSMYILVYLIAVASSVRLLIPRFIMPTAFKRVHNHYQRTTLPKFNSADTQKRRFWLTTVLAVICLSIPILAGISFLIAVCYLNVRLIYSSVSKKLHQSASTKQSLRLRWRPLLLIGIVSILLLAIPAFNLLVPAVMCTSTIHLACRDNISLLTPVLDVDT
jgi:hypothetical protein